MKSALLIPQGKELPNGFTLTEDGSEGESGAFSPISPADMFWGYDMRDPDSIPNNTWPPLPPPPPPAIYYIKQPYLLFNCWGEFIGFSWYHGEEVTLGFSYDPDMIFITPAGEQTTFGRYISDKVIKVSLLNWRMEELAVNEIPAGEENKPLKLDIDSELAKKLERGLYFMNIIVYSVGDDSSRSDAIVLMSPSDATMQII